MRPVDFPHPAGSEHADDFVRPEARTGGERHVLERAASGLRDQGPKRTARAVAADANSGVSRTDQRASCPASIVSTSRRRSRPRRRPRRQMRRGARERTRARHGNLRDVMPAFRCHAEALSRVSIR